MKKVAKLLVSLTLLASVGLTVSLDSAEAINETDDTSVVSPFNFREPEPKPPQY